MEHVLFELPDVLASKRMDKSDHLVEKTPQGPNVTLE